MIDFVRPSSSEHKFIELDLDTIIEDILKKMDATANPKLDALYNEARKNGFKDKSYVSDGIIVIAEAVAAKSLRSLNIDTYSNLDISMDNAKIAFKADLKVAGCGEHLANAIVNETINHATQALAETYPQLANGRIQQL